MLRSGWFPAALTPQGAFQPAIMGLFALVLSFTANDAWRRGDGAYEALLRETQEVAGITLLLNGLAAEGEGSAEPVRQAVFTYLRRIPGCRVEVPERAVRPWGRVGAG